MRKQLVARVAYFALGLVHRGVGITKLDTILQRRRHRDVQGQRLGPGVNRRGDAKS